MAGPTSPSGEGPTVSPPHAPAGWIVQWDGASRKYYFVKLRTGVSQWELPTEADDTGTPGPESAHPYGIPSPPEIITHPDGSQTIRHANGRMEPILPPGDSERAGLDGPTDRGLGSMAMNALLGGKNSSSNNSNSHNGSSPLGALAQQFIGGNNGHSNSSNSHSGKPSAGKLVGAFAQSLLSSNKPSNQAPQSYQSGQGQGQSHSQSHSQGPSQSQSQHGGGLAGNIVGAIFGGGKPSSNSSSSHHGQGYGYSNSGQQGTYAGHAPPTQYQPSGAPPAAPQGNGSPYYSPGAANQSPQHHQQQFPPAQPAQAPYGHQAPGAYPAAPGPYGSPQPPHDQSHASGYPPAHYANSFGQPSYSPYPPQGAPGAHGAPQQPPFAPHQHQQPADYYNTPVPNSQVHHRPTY